jgi:hypothetical protein
MERERSKHFLSPDNFHSLATIFQLRTGRNESFTAVTVADHSSSSTEHNLSSQQRPLYSKPFFDAAFSSTIKRRHRPIPTIPSPNTAIVSLRTEHLHIASNMSFRPINIGIKAIEIYFPSQVSLVPIFLRSESCDDLTEFMLTTSSALIRRSSRNLMALAKENTQLALARPR